VEDDWKKRAATAALKTSRADWRVLSPYLASFDVFLDLFPSFIL
jgi:hypothetical protein